MSDLRAKLAAAGDRETVELPGIGTVEVRTCNVDERLEIIRLSAEAAGVKDDPIAQMLVGKAAQHYMIAVTVRDPNTGELLYDPKAPEEVGSMNPDSWEKLGVVAMRVCGIDKLAQQAAKNALRASEESSTASPEISIALSQNSEDGSLVLSTVSG